MFKVTVFTIGALALGLSSFFTLPAFAVFAPFAAVFLMACIAFVKLTPQRESLCPVGAYVNDTAASTANLPTPGIDWNRIAHKPKVWVVDDDEALAIALQASLRRLGIEAGIVTNARDLHRRIIADRADYILLDWMLGSNITADMVMKKSIRIIDSASYFTEDFTNNPAHVVTYSSLTEDEIDVPLSPFFDYMGHLKKSAPRKEVLKKFSRMIYDTELQKQTEARERA